MKIVHELATFDAMKLRQEEIRKIFSILCAERRSEGVSQEKGMNWETLAKKKFHQG